MQDNVKHTLISLVAALLVAILLFAALWQSGSSSVGALAVNEVTDSDASFTESDGVRYVGSGFTVSEYPKVVERGSDARISVSAQDGDRLSISVYYASGKSASRAFDPKTAANGSAAWKWTVPSTTTASEIRVVIRSASTYATFKIAIA